MLDGVCVTHISFDVSGKGEQAKKALGNVRPNTIWRARLMNLFCTLCDRSLKRWENGIFMLVFSYRARSDDLNSARY